MRAPGAAFALVLAAVGGACAPALKKAPPLADLAGGGAPRDARAVDGLLQQAADLYARRDPESVRRAAEAALQAAAADPTRADAVIAAVRAEVWLADHEEEPEARADAATRAVQAAQWCGGEREGPPACSFWLGAALGVQARERPATGLSALPRIEAAFLRAAASDPALEDAGPERALALLYLRAPGWPAGPGDPDRGLEHARRAVGLRPDYPPNLLALAEALAATGDAEGGRATLGRALAAARDAEEHGDPEAAEWSHEAEEALAGKSER
jgi:hypothetical protein